MKYKDKDSLAEPSWAIPAEVILREYRKQERRKHRRINPNRQIPQLRDKHRRINRIPAEFGPESVQDIKGNGEPEPGDDGPGDPTVTRAGGVERLSEGAPGDGTAVVGLDLLAGPDGGALNVEEDFAVCGEDDAHDDEVEDTALEIRS